MTLITCKICQREVREKVRGQSYCSDRCRQAGFRRRTAKKLNNGVTHKHRLYPPTGTRYEATEKSKEDNGLEKPPTYYFYNAGYGSAGKPLSDVEIAALGGYVASIRASGNSQ